ncbi:putative ubiquitin-protein ligase [Emiliania huxleyi CCMP1516]|uniref:HECT-type E3 ubiquitin transferase n=2 Tax=Emiliania huxleyi TaxID=2903 RepID=A0A0D3IP98_EMIH1|nr:putative ubiquitin-protein ligase [Emiliania huxleyi CCMP1516]EOD13083.1 putative ubiquitin-protein ligase [Emiliania huxleyi CCMP1516]|eukprot:XP_005765512.1 putative ubiquitin-protein ligase [Emiliania huxleyi CCMP1516]
MGPVVKRAWLHARLEAKVGGADAVALSLVACRDNILEGLCAQLGVDEVTGNLLDGAGPQRLSVRYAGEAADGDALRREWFGLVTAEIFDPNSGLFVEDANRMLQPNPNSAAEAGADHLSYFALLGRITGMALYHKEMLNVSCSMAFLKAAFGYEIAFDDLELVDPDLHSSQKQLVSMSAEGLEALCLTFEVDGDETVVYERSSDRRRTAELKPGGADEAVTPDNIREYLQLYTRHKLLGAVGPQVAAFRSGLGVFLDEELLATLRSLCTIAEVQLLLCGQPNIDVDDWERSTVYNPPDYHHSNAVVWLWKAIREMSAEERAQLLLFTTGSTRPPATGFASLMGYRGAQQRFTVTRFDGAERLPTASACFNRLYLPEYGSEALLRAKLRLALSEAEGFAEAAVAH